jgi:glycolate oxidase iron-sulfur subunit
LDALLPRVPSWRERRALPELTAATRTRVGRAGLLAGCAQRFLLPALNRATARVLAAAGFDVVVPRDQGCCGALHLHGGRREEGRSLAKRTIRAFEAAGVDVVVANAAGCGATMKGYADLLRGEAGWQGRAEAFSAKVRDIAQILAAESWNGRLKAVPLTVTYHEACHLAHAQRIREAPRGLLRQIPALRLVELPESEVCCGGAGIYHLLEPDMAGRLLRRKVEHIRGTGARLVATGNIGCQLQIGLGLRQAGLSLPVVHPVEVLDWALHGTPNTHGQAGEEAR